MGNFLTKKNAAFLLFLQFKIQKHLDFGSAGKQQCLKKMNTLSLTGTTAPVNLLTAHDQHSIPVKPI